MIKFHPSRFPEGFFNWTKEVVTVFSCSPVYTRKMTTEIKSFRLWAMIGPQSELPYLNRIAITMPKINTEITLFAVSKCKEIQSGRWMLKRAGK